MRRSWRRTAVRPDKKFSPANCSKQMQQPPGRLGRRW